MKLAVVGAAGRMGRTLCRIVLETEGCELIGGTEVPGSPYLGQDIGLLAGGSQIGVTVSEDPLPVFAIADGVLDFTTPAATLEFAELAAQARIVHVIGTTGFGDEDEDKLEAAARHAVIVKAGNMSLGVNLLVALTEKVAASLDESFDIEILDIHHRHKVDAPSGTALMLGEAAAKGRGVELKERSVRARDGHTGARGSGDIGFAVLRGGSVVGEHDVVFAGEGETVTLSHRASDRAIFARGAVKAALWGRGKSPGMYGMRDVLGL